MTTAATIKTLLEADGTLLATATGGVWDWAETGAEGISRTRTGAAFDSNELIQPCVLVKLRSSRPDYALADDDGQQVSVQDMVECWFYEFEGYTNINTMRERVYALLHAQQISGTFQVLWTGDGPQTRDSDLDASVQRSEYQVFRLQAA